MLRECQLTRAPSRAGIVQGTAKVTEFKRQPEFATLRAAFPAGSAAGVTIGASVAINGTCLTVTQQHGDELCFDLIVETLRATNLGGLTAGSAVNFERSARIGDEVGGHNVSGHVHTTAVVSLIEETPSNRKVVFTVPRALMKYILPKASAPLQTRHGGCPGSRA
jgi:riboflavin synthase